MVLLHVDILVAALVVFVVDVLVAVGEVAAVFVVVDVLVAVVFVFVVAVVVVLLSVNVLLS